MLRLRGGCHATLAAVTAVTAALAAAPAALAALAALVTPAAAGYRAVCCSGCGLLPGRR